MKKDLVAEKVAAVDALRSSPSPLEPLRAALRDRNNLVCAKAAAVAKDLLLLDLVPDLVAAFDRFLQEPVKRDPQCWAKLAVIRALKEMGHEDAAVYLRGMSHVQMEPVWGGKADSAAALRGACAVSLVACNLPRDTILTHLADLLADPEMQVRSDAVRAIGQLPGLDSMLMLRVKVHAGDDDPAVIGQCFLSMLGMDARRAVAFVGRFLERSDNELWYEAAAALGECPELGAVELLIARWKAEVEAEKKKAIQLSLGVSRVPEAKAFLDHLRAETD